MIIHALDGEVGRVNAPQWDRDKPIDLAFEQKLAAYTTSISVIDGAG